MNDPFVFLSNSNSSFIQTKVFIGENSLQDMMKQILQILQLEVQEIYQQSTKNNETISILQDCNQTGNNINTGLKSNLNIPQKYNSPSYDSIDDSTLYDSDTPQFTQLTNQQNQQNQHLNSDDNQECGFSSISIDNPICNNTNNHSNNSNDCHHCNSSYQSYPDSHISIPSYSNSNSTSSSLSSSQNYTSTDQFNQLNQPFSNQIQPTHIQFIINSTENDLLLQGKNGISSFDMNIYSSIGKSILLSVTGQMIYIHYSQNENNTNELIDSIHIHIDIHAIAMGYFQAIQSEKDLFLHHCSNSSRLIHEL